MDSIPEALYPEEELLRYNLTTNSESPKSASFSSNYQNAPAELIRIKKKTKHKVQTTNKASVRIRRQFSERSWTLRNWYAHVHWKNFTVVALIPLLGIFLLCYKHPPLINQTFYFTLVNYMVTVISINILYHRYWSHHSFNFTNESLVHFLALICSGGGITSAKNWCSSHRAHHRYCDVTDTDPHNIRRGFFFSHMGWMILIHHSKAASAIKESKLDQLPSEKIVKWQLENYFLLYILVGLVIPCISCGYLFNDYWGGLIYSGFIKIIMVQHSIFSINSIGHTFGSRPYNDSKSARNNSLLGLITMGEGNQNFHQEFPMDYRNGCGWYCLDPTKWTIRLFQILGQVTDLKKASQSTIDKSFIQQQQKLLDNKRSQLNWGIPIERLPVFSPEEFRRLAQSSENRYFVVVSGIIHDVTPFAHDHPGGLPLIRASHGKDASTAFNGAVYQHSNAARNLLATMRIGALGGSENLFWKQQRMENKAVPIDNDSEGKRIVRSGGQATNFGVLGGTAGAA